MAAQGQNFFAASGDSSTWSKSNEAWPADDAYVVSVGGTDLVTTKAAGPWSSETAWVDSGGGISPDMVAIPSCTARGHQLRRLIQGSTVREQPPTTAPPEAKRHGLHCDDLNHLPRQRVTVASDASRRPCGPPASSSSHLPRVDSRANPRPASLESYIYAEIGTDRHLQSRLDTTSAVARPAVVYRSHSATLPRNRLPLIESFGSPSSERLRVVQ